MNAILVVNAGSSSVKFQLFDVAAPESSSADKRTGGRHRHAASASRRTADGSPDRPIVCPDEVADVPAAISAAGQWCAKPRHRTHRGRSSRRPWWSRLRPASPGRQKRACAIGAVCCAGAVASTQQPGADKVLAPASAGTASDRLFRHGLSSFANAVIDHYAIPEQFYREGIRRYGFHGLSYEYIAARLYEMAPDVAKRRVIVAHLGSGASMCALAGGRSIESTMGFTALDGMPMGTRSGQIDPGVLLYMLAERG